MKNEIKYKKLRRNLQKVREKAGMSLEQMAEKSGFPESRLKSIESGRHKPTLELVYAYAMVLSCSVDFLLSTETRLQKRNTERTVLPKQQECTVEPTYLTFHCTFNKISIHRGCLELLGRPERIQILVSPSTKEIALRGAASTEADTFRVLQSVYEPGGQFRIRCDEFLKRLRELMGWSDDYAYRVEGSYGEG